MTTSRGKLFTFNTSVAERYWCRIKGIIIDSVNFF
nr:hypothetical protein [Richelia intracellularis]